MKLENKLVKDCRKEVQDMIALISEKNKSFKDGYAIRKRYNNTIAAHYHGNPITNSTDAVEDMDYIQSEVAAVVDGNTSIAMKGIAPSDRLVVDFAPLNNDDTPAAKQAEGVVSHVLNSWNNPGEYLEAAIQDDGLYGSGVLHVYPEICEDSRVVVIEGVEAEHKAFKQRILNNGMEVRKIGDVDMGYLEKAAIEFEEGEEPYGCEYKITRRETRIRIKPLDTDFLIVDPLTVDVADQAFIGTLDNTTIAAAMQKYPEVNLEKLFKYSEFQLLTETESSVNLSNQQGGTSLPPDDGRKDDMGAKEITIQRCWYRHDKHGLLEVVLSGSYIFYIKPIDFHPIVKITGTPFSHNFYGSSLARRAIFGQEYGTATVRSGIKYSWETTSNQNYVNHDTVEIDSLEDGNATVLIDNDFRPERDLGLVPKQLGDFNAVVAMTDKIKANMRDITGVPMAGDIVNTEIMHPGNSALKVQLATTPMNLLQERRIKNYAVGVRRLAHLVWRTTIQIGGTDDLKNLISKISAGISEAPEDMYLDYESIIENFDFVDRNNMDIKLAIGMQSEENRIANQEIMIDLRNRFIQNTMGLMEQGLVNEDFIEGYRRMYIEPYEDIFGRRDVDSIIPTTEEILQLAENVAQQREAESQLSESEQIQLAELQSKVEKNMADAAEKRGKLNLIGAQTDQATANAEKLRAEARVAKNAPEKQVIV